MIEINKINNRTWSMLGTRRTFGAALNELAADWANLVVLSGDAKTSSGLDRFANNNPQKYFSGGIAEQNLVCVASGLASEGKVVFVTCFSPFMTGRCYDQIRVHLGMMRHNVKLVGLASGVGFNFHGNTHFGLDDASLMSLIPNMAVVSPADCAEVVKATEAAYYYDGPVYLRLCGENNMPIINKEDYQFEIGKAIELRAGKDVSIIASGTMVAQALKAAELLQDKGINVSVVNMHTIKPLDHAAVDEALGAKLIVTAEEGFVNGGLAAMLLQYLSGKIKHPPVLTLGIKDAFPEVGNYLYILNQLGLTGEHMANAIENRLAQIT